MFRREKPSLRNSLVRKINPTVKQNLKPLFPYPEGNVAVYESLQSCQVPSVSVSVNSSLPKLKSHSSCRF